MIQFNHIQLSVIHGNGIKKFSALIICMYSNRSFAARCQCIRLIRCVFFSIACICIHKQSKCDTERRTLSETNASNDTHHFKFGRLIRSHSLLLLLAVSCRCSCMSQRCTFCHVSNTLHQLNICHSLLGLDLKRTHFRVARCCKQFSSQPSISFIKSMQVKE